MSSKPAESLPEAPAVKNVGVRPASIASRLVVLFTIAASLLLLCAMGALYWIVIRYIENEANQFLADRAEVLRADLREDAGPVALRKELEINRPDDDVAYFIRVLDATGKTVAETRRMSRVLPVSLFPKPAGEGDVLPRATDYRTPHNKWFLLASTSIEVGGQSYTIQIGQDRSDDKRFAKTFRRLVGSFLGCGILLSVGMALFVAKRGLRPLDEMAAAVERIGATDFHERIGTTRWPRELRSLSSAFDAMMGRLEDSFTRLSQFSADLAHELRTPVANLRGEAEVALAKAREASEYRAVIESSVEECERLSRMIDSLLFLARADAVETGTERSLLDLRAESEALIEYYDAVAQDKGIELSCEGEGKVVADPLLFRRALSNLVSNALKFTQHGSVRVLIAEAGDHADVSVADSGCGIAPQHAGRVFDRFYRADASRNSQGTGLGLAIVKSIMTLHAGSVSLESKPGQGTAVTLRFPK